MGRRYQQSDPFDDGGPISPSDGTVLSPTPRALVVLNAGNVVLELNNGATITYTNAPTGAILPWACVKRVKVGTTAIVAWGT